MKRIYFLLIVTCIGSLSFSQSKKLHFKKGINSDKKESLLPSRSVSENKNYIEINYNFEDAGVINIKQDTDQFQLIRVKGFGIMGDVGKPALPCYNDILVVPQKEGLKINILEANYQEYDNYYIQPALEPQIDSEKTDTKIKIDKSTYSSNLYFPKDIVEISSVQIYRDIPLAFVQIRPIQFNPKTKKIRCYSNIKYQIVFDGSNTTKSSKNRKESLAILKNVVSNPKSLESSLIRSSGVSRSISSVTANSDTTYLIITTDEFLPAAEEFARWKTILGFKCDIVSQATWTSSQVKSAISTRYTAYKPDYFLIIGDHEDVPGKDYWCMIWPHNFVTDYYYACNEGENDFIPDMAHGRVSVSSLEEAYLVLRKIINYEQNPIVNSAFYQTGLHCAYFQDTDNHDGIEDYNFVFNSERIRNYLIDHQGKTINRVYNTKTYYIPRYYQNGDPIPLELRKDISPFFNWNGDAAGVTSEINSGKFYVLHRDHGSFTAWGEPAFDTANISNLSNGDKLPVVFCINCQNGGFSDCETSDNVCFAEKFIRHPGGGAVGVFAASQESYSAYNDPLVIGMFDAIWSNPGLLPDFGNGEIPTVTQHSDIFKMGLVLNQGLLRMEQTYGQHLYTNRIFHYFGDPSMEMYTSSPSTFSNPGISENGSSVTVSTGVDSCKITISSMLDMGESFYEVMDTVSSHTFIPNDVSKPYYISITKHNYKPYICITSTYIQNRTFSLDSCTISGRNIYLGENVTTTQTQGSVIIESGAHVTFSTEQDVFLESGFETKLGGSFETKKQ